MTNEDEKKKHLRLLLVGKSGNGKSSSGNTIFFEIGEEGFSFMASHKTGSSTRRNDEQTKCIDGIDVTIVDTPGTQHTTMGEQFIVKEIYSAVEKDEDGFDAIIITLKYTEEGFNKDERKSLQLLEKTFSSKDEIFFHRVIFLFTFGDDWDRVQQRRQILKERKREFKEEILRDRLSTNSEAIGPIMKKSNYRLVLFDNSEGVGDDKKKEMSNTLLDMVKGIISEGDKNYKRFTKADLPPQPTIPRWQCMYSWM